MADPAPSAGPPGAGGTGADQAVHDRATAGTDGATDGATDGTADGGQPAKGRRRLKPSTRIGLIVILGIAVVAGAIFAISYFVDSSHYISTDNAQIDGTQIIVAAPASGTLEDWKGTAGRSFSKDEAIGHIRIQAGFVQPLMTIRAPGAGTVAVDHGVPGTFVTVGSQLAVAYDYNQVFVTARVDETAIQDVRVGQLVDISVDGFSGAPLTGQVREIQGAAAGVFSLLPNSNSSGNYQKVTQVIPVKIAIDDRKGLPLVPGMNCTVKIHRS
jgi:multidrug resistance efflux pump